MSKYHKFHDQLRPIFKVITFLVTPVITNLELFNVWKLHQRKNFDQLIRIIIQNIEEKSNKIFKKDAIRSKICGFIATAKRKWKKCSYVKKLFEQRESSWLARPFQYLVYEDCDAGTSRTPAGGRPELSYNDCSRRSKRRKINDFCKKFDANLVHKASERLSQIKSKKATDKEFQLENGALAMFLDLKLSKRKYESLRDYNDTLLDAKYYPPYAKILQKKKECYPEGIVVKETGAYIPLQSLLNHTSTRILQSIRKELTKESEGDLMLMGKWGMDGSTGQQIFNQKWEDQENFKNVDEKSIFMVTFVPLQLISTQNKQVIWKNERPSSIRYCRPVRFMFAKETVQNVQKEYKTMCSEINNVLPTEVQFDDSLKFRVYYDLKCTMVDGKVTNILTGQKSSRSCNICGAKPKEMNNIKLVRSLIPNEDNYGFGLSTLHCWIRFMEFLLHISYNQDFEKTYALKENKSLKEDRKRTIQDEIRKKIGLCIDMPRPNTANSNDGNVARTFFKNYIAVYKILNIDVNLVRRFYCILQVLASGQNVVVEKFKIYCDETYEILLNLYRWYTISPSVHKVLIHGADIINHLGPAIGAMSEEAQEASNKIFKSARLNNSRNFSRIQNNEDILHYLLVSSDPLISQLRIKREATKMDMLPEAQSMLN